MRVALRSLGLVACGVIGLAVPTFAQSAAKAPMTPESMWALQRVGEPALSPNGQAAVVPISRFDVARDVRISDLYLVPTAGGPMRQLTADEANEATPSFSPDGRFIAFVARRSGDREPQLYVLPTDGGEARRITSVPTGVVAPKWFSDSRRVAFLSTVWPGLKTWDEQAKRLQERADSKMTARVWDKPPVTHWDRYLDDRETHIYVVDITTTQVSPITVGSGHSVDVREPGLSSYDVAPDGSEVAFAGEADRSGIQSNIDIFTVPVTGGPARNLTAANKADDGNPAYSPDGRYLAFGQQVIAGFYADRVRLILVDRRSGQSRELTGSWDRSATGKVWLPDSSGLYGSIDDAGTRRIYRFDVRGGTPRAVTAANDFASLAVAGRPATLVAVRQSFSEPGTLVRVDTRTGAAAPLTAVNDAALARMDFGKVESVTYKGANNADIQMWVVYPPGFDRTKKYPLFLLLHGGPHNAITDAWTWRWNAHVFAGWGYVVAWHNFHGSSGFGQDFTDSINPNRADKPYEDTIAAARWFQDKPWIDSNRMVAGGGSYGGYLASVLLGRANPFKALIAHAAVYNNYTQVAADYGGDRDRFFEYWERPEEFQRYSPHMAAANFNTPTLVIHGQLDYRVPVNHGIELFHTLSKRGVPTRLVYYPNENHWILKPQNSIFWYGEVRKWVERYAAPGPR
jgi:dipeptidyl aminopeptidase/acylaminoacyl peptidase